MWRNVSAAALRRHHWAVRIKSHHTHTPHTRADRNHYTPTYISLPHCLITSHLQCRWRRYPAPLRLLSTRPCSDIHAKIFFQMIGTHEKIEFLYQVSKMCRWILISNTFIPCLKGKLKPEVIIFFWGATHTLLKGCVPNKIYLEAHTSAFRLTKRIVNVCK